MGRIKKKGTAGQAKNFITRTQAVRKLQISLPDFRRLCIFKGIYPREPRNKKKASKSSTAATTFYYTKDIQYLLHEPLLNKFRDYKTLAKKISRALGKGEVRDAARLDKAHTPKHTLDHIIKERYPTFVDALRDLDDALSMLFLFANLPSTSTVPPKTIQLCQRLCLEFEHYLIMSHSMRKSFLSIKGIYYQATIQGQDILWLVPYKFVQRVTGDIDFRIMGTFVEFYTTLLGFVNFRLYNSVGLIYPPKFDASSDERGAELGAFTLQERDITIGQKQLKASTPNGDSAEVVEATSRAQLLANSLDKNENSLPDAPTADQPEDDTEGVETAIIDSFTATGADADTLPQPAPSTNEAASLFSPFTFFLSRETPRQPLEFLLKSFGCRRVGWDLVLGDGAFTGNENDPAITHQIVDRPAQPVQSTTNNASAEADHEPKQAARGRVPGRTYVQPQWVWDCVNEGKLLRPDLYAPGATLPPHLSPWVKPTKGVYDPTVPLDDDENLVETSKSESVVDGVKSVKATADLIVDEEDVDSGMEVDVDGDEDEDEEDEDDAEDSHSGPDLAPKKSLSSTQADDFGGFSSDEDEDLHTHQNELLAEASGQAPTKLVTKATEAQKQRKAAEKAKKEKAEAIERAQMMLPRKKRKLLGKMLYSNAKKDEEAEKLRAKRRKLEKA